MPSMALPLENELTFQNIVRPNDGAKALLQQDLAGCTAG